MLALSRKPDETIVIAGNIYVTVLAVRGNKVSIGVQADAGVPVDRLEVHEAKQREKREAFLG